MFLKKKKQLFFANMFCIDDIIQHFDITNANFFDIFFSFFVNTNNSHRHVNEMHVRQYHME